ncbi:unnamed protein product [Ambrosiozyma monospora]|uniref:Unnamed protein product n=1 Tax=Ambrosiozyma monospora TaxID=43982 RepID=A0ACB5T5R4_AMBMO|nr:unnamed protein product [Ambrosiozyma monospora]
MEVRDYQFDIVKSALFENLLCSLPTGLGKTFIASTVMLNFYRWTKTAKIVFMAPTKPLVAQQIKAFYGISGIPSTDIAILLDKSKKNRREIWDSNHVFFTTPQVVDNDLRNGLLDPKAVVCLVVDEAHRARGNYAYVKVTRYITQYNTSFRVLALTATPGATTEAIQDIVYNLSISKIEVRTEDDEDIAKYIKVKDVLKLDCDPTPEIHEITSKLCDAILPILEVVNSAGIYDITDPTKINHFLAMEASQRLIRRTDIQEGYKWNQYFRLQVIGTVGTFFRRLNIYGIKTFYSFFTEKYKEFTTKYNDKKSTNAIGAAFYYDANVAEVKKYVEDLIAEDDRKAAKGEVIRGLFSHNKLKCLIDELVEFFEEHKGENSSVIVFTEFRENALELVNCIESANKFYHLPNTLRPHIFIGQSKEKEKFDEVNYAKKKNKKKKNNKKGEADNEKGKASARPSNRGLDNLATSTSELAQIKGMNQQLQKQLIENFKKGEFNILVATSIGEEGLDIGEVDLIVCFDSTQSPIKNIQRMGRTGRKRDGKVVLLFSSNERSKFEKAMDNYSFIQKKMNNPDEFKFVKSDRILPESCHPRVDKQRITIDEDTLLLLKESENENSDAFLKLMAKTVNGSTKSNPKSLVNKKKKNSRESSICLITFQLGSEVSLNC